MDLFKPELFKPERLLAFSDGVFGVAITLLVIDLRLPPSAENGEDAALLHALLDMGPRLVIFAFTFIIVGMSWIGHHRKFNYIARVDGRLLWMNLIYLMALCLVPFVSSVLSEHGGRTAFMLYACVMMIVSGLSAALSAYGLRRPFLANPDLRSSLRRGMVLSPLLMGAIFAAAAGMAFGGHMRGAHLIPLMIVPVMVYFGARVRRP